MISINLEYKKPCNIVCKYNEIWTIVSTMFANDLMTDVAGAFVGMLCNSGKISCEKIKTWIYIDISSPFH